MAGQILHWEDGVARVVNNRGLYAKLLGKFAVSQANVPDAIAAAIHAGNMEEAKHLTHTLKGTAANLGAELLADAGMVLEEALKNNADTTQPLATVRECLEQTLDAMKAFQA